MRRQRKAKATMYIAQPEEVPKDLTLQALYYQSRYSRGRLNFSLEAPNETFDFEKLIDGSHIMMMSMQPIMKREECAHARFTIGYLKELLYLAEHMGEEELDLWVKNESPLTAAGKKVFFTIAPRVEEE